MSHLVYSAEDADSIKASGRKMLKKPHPVYMLKPPTEDAFTVRTNEGFLTAEPGSLVAYDPISGHVWPVAADYVAVHYEDAE